MISRFKTHFGRLVRARRLQIPFTRTRSFVVPETILLRGRKVRLSFPEEKTTAISFLECLLDDAYGLSNFPMQPKTILDVGANLGFFSLAARNRFPDATIHAYEPNPRILQHLQNQANLARVVIHPEAVGASGGYVHMVESTKGSGVGRTESDEVVRPESIMKVSLAEAIDRLGGTCDLAKIDCEGAEWDLFRAGSAWKYIKHVRMEYHLWAAHSLDELSSTINRLGFRIVKQVQGGDTGMVYFVNNAA
jgi:FkbM family methyltransferase